MNENVICALLGAIIGGIGSVAGGIWGAKKNYALIKKDRLELLKLEEKCNRKMLYTYIHWALYFLEKAASTYDQSFTDNSRVQHPSEYMNLAVLDSRWNSYLENAGLTSDAIMHIKKWFVDVENISLLSNGKKDDYINLANNKNIHNIQEKLRDSIENN